jgi:hypothetical protein
MQFACLLVLALAVQDDASALIRKLGSETLEEREAASNALLKMGKAARPAILEATNHRDAEISRRAKSILERIEFDVDFTLSSSTGDREEASQARLSGGSRIGPRMSSRARPGTGFLKRSRRRVSCSSS